MKGWIKPLKELADKHPAIQSGDMQMHISKKYIGESSLFEFLDEGQQGEIVYEIMTKGITKVINESTKQTDLMEEAENKRNQLVEIAEKHNISMSHQYNVSVFCGVGEKLWKNLDRHQAEQILTQLKYRDSIFDLIKDAESKSLRTSADSDQIVDRKQMAMILDRQIKSAMTDIYIATSEIIDQKLFRELGHKTAKSYFETLAISERKMYEYAVIGRELKPHAYLSDGSVNPSMEVVGSMQMSKLYEIVTKASDQIQTLIESGQITISGETVSREELEAKSVRDLRNQLKEAKAAKEENDRLKYEKKHLERSVEDLKEDNQTLSKYRDNLTQEKEVRKALEEFSAHIADSIRVARNIKLDELDSTLQAEVVKRINTGFDLLERYTVEYADIFTRFAD